MSLAIKNSDAVAIAAALNFGLAIIEGSEIYMASTWILVGLGLVTSTIEESEW